MQSLKWLALALAVSLVASNAQAQQLDESPEKEAQEQLDAFTDEAPEREMGRARLRTRRLSARRGSARLGEIR